MGTHSSRIVLTMLDREPISYRVPWGSEKKGEFYDNYYESLMKFKDRLRGSNLEKDFLSLSSAFKHILEDGFVLFCELFGDNFSLIHEYLSVFLTTSTDPLEPLGVIEIIAQDFADMFPVEGLVLWDESSIEEYQLDNINDLHRLASLVLGFSFIVKRTIERGGLSQKRTLRNDPKLPVKYFYNHKLTHVQNELQFFRAMGAGIHFDGPWPQASSQFDVDEFIRYLYDLASCFPGDGPDGETRLTIIDEIHHFSCHCFTEATDSKKSSIELVPEKSVSIQKMTLALRKLQIRQNRNNDQEDMPLIFLNACESSKILPKAQFSFPKFFLQDVKNCGFIGSEIAIPDEFASYFTRLFYEYLLKGYGIGEAVFIARRRMLEVYKNPLGILYKMYGDPYLRVTHPIEDS